jgi:hypothetical protein
MFARWVDFSVPSNQDMIVRVASGLNLVRSSTYNQGDGVVILTQVMYVDDAQCTGAGLTIAQCLNWRRNVIMKRVVIGNAGLRSSAYGTPLAALLGADGSLSSPDYLKEPSALVPLSAQLPQMAGGDFAYVSEACFNMPGLSLPYVAGGGVSYAQSIW